MFRRQLYFPGMAVVRAQSVGIQLDRFGETDAKEVLSEYHEAQQQRPQPQATGERTTGLRWGFLCDRTVTHNPSL